MVGDCFRVLYDEWGKLWRQTITSQSLDLWEFIRIQKEEGFQREKNDAKKLLLIFNFQFFSFWRWWAIYQVILFQPERWLNQVWAQRHSVQLSVSDLIACVELF